MVARKCLLFIAIFALLICTGEAAAGPNANAVLSLDLIADGGAGNQRDDGVISGTVSGQGTKIAVEVFAQGVTTPLLGILVEFDFDASVLTYVKAENSEFIYILPAPDGANFAANALVTLSESGFLVRAEFTTAVDVTDREFSIGIKRVGLAESPTSSDSITTTNVVTFNAAPSPDVAPSPDFDGDGVVGIPDFLQFVDRFGAMRGDGKYEAKYDLDGNGAIGVPDFLIFVDNFGKEVPPSGDAEMVTIPDMNLRAVIEDSLGKASGAPITRDEMATLTHFAAVNANISDLTGLEFATDLTVLGIGNTSISDLAPLSGLTNLQGLLLVNNNISDISSLSGLTGLTTLILSNNSISDLSPLSGLTGLQGLLLDNNSISDLSPLVENTGLGSGDEVNVRSNPLSNTSIDTHIPALQGRGVAVLFHVIDPTPVNIPDENLRAAIEDALDKSRGATITRGDMSTLTSLNASNANISDLTGLEFAIFLTSLVLHNNSITDLSPLSGMTSLTRLRLENNSISDVSALSGLTNLTRLTLYRNRISDLSPLVANTGLGSGDRVDVRTNPLSATSIDTHIPALQGRGVEVQF